ncbi:hypothetical protein TYRP_012174 [Tyrophagus putrescentiae]|nr:hypothetical protein TYRP_012174 [Tyrophagus putrescentiae]
MHRIGQRPSPGVSGQSLPPTLLTTSWRPPLHSPRRRSTAHRNTGPRRRSIAHATLVLSALVRSSGPQSQFDKSLSPNPRQQGQQLLRPRWAITPSRAAPSTGHSGPTPGHSGPTPGHSGPTPGHSGPTPGHSGPSPRPSPGHTVAICIMATRGHRQATQGLSPGYSEPSPGHSRAISL